MHLVKEKTKVPLNKQTNKQSTFITFVICISYPSEEIVIIYKELCWKSNNISIIFTSTHQERQHDNVGKNNILFLNFCCQMFQINEHWLWQGADALNNLCLCRTSKSVTKVYQILTWSSLLKALFGDYVFLLLQITSFLSFLPQNRYNKLLTKKINREFKKYIPKVGNSYHQSSEYEK